MDDTQPAQWRQRRPGHHLCLELDGEVRWTPDSTGEDLEPREVPTPPKTRKRKPDFIKQVKRAMAAGLNVRSASITPDGVVVTFGEAEAPADGKVIETADELRKLL